ncbi:MAG: DUF5060 domain-containing protein [Anaerolineae bacterium]
MVEHPTKVDYRSVMELVLTSTRDYQNPFADVELDAVFTAPSGRQVAIPGFYDGDGVWRVRFNPGEVGRWSYEICSRPADPELTAEGSFEVTPRETRGFLQCTPGDAWGFRFESGEAAFLLGDTTYNLFGMAHAAEPSAQGDVEEFLRRRAKQGFGLLRVRLQVSPFHGPRGYSAWQKSRTWPWGGSEQAPQLDRFNLDYFQTVDRVMRLVEDLGLGLEMIMEAWGFEFPFNNRAVFVPEWEDLWLRYLIARYDAFRAVYVWTLLNEYEYYPDGDWRYSRLADRWALRRARWVKDLAQHGHVVAVHNGPTMPPFAERLKRDPGAVDAVMFQTWGSMGDDDAWLAAGIETQIERSLDGWSGSAIFAEWGYERNPDLPLNLPHHKNCSVEHTRRGAWRGTFSALNIIHGFENSWGPFMVLREDQAGLAQLLHVRHFFTEIVPFERLRPMPELIHRGHEGGEPGTKPLVLATPERTIVAVYLPVGGTVELDLPTDLDYRARWYDPRTGNLTEVPTATEVCSHFEAPEGCSEGGHPWDWILLLESVRASE